MSDGDEESDSTPDETDADPLVDEFESRLDDAQAALDDAETEADLDDVDEQLDEIEADLEEAEFDVEEPEDEDEEPEDPKEPLEERLGDIRDAVEEQRGPYGSDVVDAIDDVRGTIADTRWAEEGKDELVPGVEAFIDDVTEHIEADFGEPVADPSELAGELETAMAAVENADLDADDDADTIAALLDIASDLSDAVDDSTAWLDLEVREQLRREGFYEPIEGRHHKDFPPEWSALKTWETRANVDMVLLLLEKMGDSEFIQRHCIRSLGRIGDPKGIPPLTRLANRRNELAVQAIGMMGSEEGVSALQKHAQATGNPSLQGAALKALGAIGSEDTTELVAQQLVVEEPSVRSQAARSLGMIGDTRAIEPLADVLADDDDQTVRASAAWALVRIGTERALEAAAPYAEDEPYLVAAEAEKAVAALEDGEVAPA